MVGCRVFGAQPSVWELNLALGVSPCRASAEKLGLLLLSFLVHEGELFEVASSLSFSVFPS